MEPVGDYAESARLLNGMGVGCESGHGLISSSLSFSFFLENRRV